MAKKKTKAEAEAEEKEKVDADPKVKANAIKSADDTIKAKAEIESKQIKIRAKDLAADQKQYWRGGKSYAREWETFDADVFTDKQREALNHDPRIEIETA